MLIFKEKMGSVFLMEKETENVRYEVTNPAVLFDTSFFAVLKIGNRDMVEAYYEESVQKCMAKQSDLYESWVLMDLPLDEHVLTKIMNNPGYIETFYGDLIKTLSKGEQDSGLIQ